MPAPTILPGRAFQQNTRKSNLLFHWRAADLTLNAVTGEAGVFTRASAGGLVQARGLFHDRDPGYERRLAGPHTDGVPRWEWVPDENGVYVPVLRLEGTRTNLCLRSEVMGTTWTASNITVASNATWAPDALTTADTLTASAGNGTLIQDLGVLGSAAYTFSIWLKRKTGTGNVDLTLDGGGSWTTVAVTSTWTRFSLTQTLANPDCGIRLVTNADAVYAWGGQAEAGSFRSSYMATVASTSARAAETLYWPYVAKPQALSVYGRVEDWAAAQASMTVFHVGSATAATDPRLNLDVDASGDLQATYDDGSTAAQTSAVTGPSEGQAVEYLVTLSKAGALNLAVAYDGGAQASATAGAGGALSGISAWAAQRLYLNSAGSTLQGFQAHRVVKVAREVQTMAYMKEAY